jgi:hypothetical protein
VRGRVAGIELLKEISKSRVFTVLRPLLKRNWSQMELKSWPSWPRMVGDCPVEVITTPCVDREPQFSGTYRVQPLPPITEGLRAGKSTQIFFRSGLLHSAAIGGFRMRPEEKPSLQQTRWCVQHCDRSRRLYRPNHGGSKIKCQSSSGRSAPSRATCWI